MIAGRLFRLCVVLVVSVYVLAGCGGSDMDGEIDLGGLLVPMPATDEWELADGPPIDQKGIAGSVQSRVTTEGAHYAVTWTYEDGSAPVRLALSWLTRSDRDTVVSRLASCKSAAVIGAPLEFGPLFPDLNVAIELDDGAAGALQLLAEFDASEGRDGSFEAFVERQVPVFAEAFVGARFADGTPFLPCDRDAALREIETFLKTWAARMVPQVAVVPTRVPVVAGLAMEEAVSVRVELPVFDEDFEDGLVPRDLPGLQGAGSTRRWAVEVDLGTGAVAGWPPGRVQDSTLWVKDGGTYELVDAEGRVIARLEDRYVPRALFVMSSDLFGDGFRILIGEDGRFVGWPETVVLSDFETDS